MTPRLYGDENADDRAVSEIVAFILVFSIIILSVGILSVTGFQAIVDYSEGEQLQNAERAMDSFADNVNDLARYDGIESRSGELSLRDGSIRATDDSTLLEIDLRNETNDITEIDADLGALEYQKGSETIAYEGGGVFRSDGEGGSVAASQPLLKCTDDVAIISLLVIESDQGTRQAGGGVDVTATKTNSETTMYDKEIDQIAVADSDGERASAWEAVLEDQGMDEDGDCDAERTLIRNTTIEIDY